MAAQDLDPGRLETTWVGLPDLESTLFDTPVCRDGSVDLVLVPADWLPRLATRGLILPLDEHVVETPPVGWPASWSHAFVDVLTFAAAGTYGLWGAPFHDGPPIFIYRSDLYESVTEQAAYRERFGVELVPARTWAEFDRQAEWFTRPGEGLAGTVLAGAPDGHNNVYDFVTQLRLRGGDVLDGRVPAFGGAAGAGALVWLRRHLVDRPTVPPGSRRLDSVGSGRAFASGGVALMMNWAGYAHAAEGPSSSVVGRVGVALAPALDDGRPTPVVNAFWALAVTAGSRRPADAWSLVRDCLSPEGDIATTRAGSSGCRLETWRDPKVLARTPAFALFEAAHSASRPLPLVAELPLLVEILNDLVEAVVGRGEDAEGCLARAVAAAAAVMEADSADV